MKTLTNIGLALALAVGSSSVMASGNHGKHGHRHDNGWNVTYHYSPHVDRRHRGHHNRWHHDRWSYSPRHYRGHPRGHWRYRRHGWYYPSYLGAAIVGSVIGHSAYHLHGSSVCYDAHERDGRRGGYDEIAGCHRVERMPDGSERRVDVPLSQCN